MNSGLRRSICYFGGSGIPRQLPLRDAVRDTTTIRRPEAMFAFYSNKLGCGGSILISIIGTAILVVAVRACSL